MPTDIDHKKLSILEDDIQLVVVYDGPRGLPGAPGPKGADGNSGSSIIVRGPWQPGTQYLPGEAVTHRSSLAQGMQSMWILRDGFKANISKPPFEEPNKWSEIGGVDPDRAFGSMYEVHQVRHPFQAIGQPVAFYASTNQYELADNRLYDRLALGVIREVKDGDNFVVQTSGEIDNLNPRTIYDPGGAGLLTRWVPGDVYYLSSVPGFVQRKPGNDEGFISQPIICPTETNPDGSVRGVVLGWGPSGHIPPVAPGASPPPYPQAGDMWYRTENYPGLYIWLTTAGQSQWVQTNG